MENRTLPKHLTLHEFQCSEDLVEALVTEISHQLDRAIQIRGGATLAVSGGRTPKKVFTLLSRAELDWTRITVTLVDERWVDPGDERSNERLVIQNLLVGRAAFAHFVPLYHADISVQEAAVKASDAINGLHLPLDVVVLGMGVDGHTASYFSDADELSKATDPAVNARVLAINSAVAGEPRLTLTIPVLAASRFIALHIEGKDKRNTLELALQNGDANTYPVRHLLQRSDVNTNIFWAP